MAHSAVDVDITVSGFGTLGYAISDNSESEYVRGTGLDGADNSGSFKVDSRIGLQLDSYFNERYSSTIQGIVRQNHAGNFDPEVEWAFFKWLVNDSTSFRIGRLVDPAFMHSQVREVGFGNTSLRLPEVVYRQIPVTNFDGVDLSLYFSREHSEIATRLYAGKSTTIFPGATRVETNKLFGFTLDYERGIIRWRFGYTYAGLEYDSPEISAAEGLILNVATQFPEVEPFANDFKRAERPTHSVNMGLEADLDPWYFNVEWLILNAAGLAADDRGWYAKVGYRIDRLTPYLGISSVRQTSKGSLQNPSIAALDPLFEQLSLIYKPIDQDSLTVGLRWDFARRLALKVQVDYFKRKTYGISFERPQDVDFNNDNVRLFSLGLDFLF